MSDILVSAFILSLVLVGIHSFYGLEIIKRGIIFTDLAIGQTAALGAAVSMFFLHGAFLYPVSLSFALIGGLIIALAGRKKGNNLEAFIGLLYAFGISGVFIILSKSYHGMEEFQKLMASDILFTPVEEIIKTAIIYACVGLVLFFLYRRSKGFIRDAIFFTSFAVTVTSSVRLAGVLIVFALLVSPALISMHIKKGIPLINAWIAGTVINLVSIIVSYRFDFPTGYTLVFCNSLCALITVILPGKDKK
ncbi:MAG: metal ABC transporter permease [Spirochaetota bacterium]